MTRNQIIAVASVFGTVLVAVVVMAVLRGQTAPSEPTVPETAVPTSPSGPAPLPSEPVSKIDRDADGLANDEEARLGTDPDRVDTDGDGLMDGAEVRTLKTDPLKPNAVQRGSR